MKKNNSNIDAFFTLLNAGLWEKSVWLIMFEPLDFEALYKLAEAQSVVGLLAAGLEHVKDRIVTKQEALPFLKKVVSQENRNTAMNFFIEKLIGEMRDAGIYTILVKGQGTAQCYERPLWRAAGDIDLFMDAKNYEKAKCFFSKKNKYTEVEGIYTKHLGISIDSWTVELHGTLRCGLSARIDRELDHIQSDTFMNGRVRTWRNGDTDVFLPGPDNDVIFVFTHILKHFYKGGIGLRQICDWCRILWFFRDTIDRSLLESRLHTMGLLSEWRSFAALAVNYLGMSADAMPLYVSSERWDRKSRRICDFILEVGSFGKNRDLSYYKKFPYVVRKTISLFRRLNDMVRHAFIFPLDSVLFFPQIVINGLRSAARGE